MKKKSSSSIFRDAKIPQGAILSFKMGKTIVPDVATVSDYEKGFASFTEKYAKDYMEGYQKNPKGKDKPLSSDELGNVFSLNRLSKVITVNNDILPNTDGFDAKSYYYKGITIPDLKEFYKKNPTGNPFKQTPDSAVELPDRNLIYFGAPGTGKSWALNENQKKLFSKDNVERVTFHPDYSYSDFVGCYKPVSEQNGEIKYEYVLGPFLRVLEKALKNKKENYLLIIEEINRANVAAVFGDIFQLLDRNGSGESDYFITPSDEMKKRLNLEKLGIKELRIPSNMYIWATMNSADQGVFPMDTAFKRRWSFQYLDIDNNEENVSEKNVKIETRNGFQTIKWNELRKAINKKLTDDLRINEDKLIGPYFLKPELITDDKFKDAFKNKVLMYLFDDAAKHKGGDLFNNYEQRFSSILRGFDSAGIDIFQFDENTKQDILVNETETPENQE